MDKEIVDRLIAICGEDWVITDLDQMRGYLKDETPTSVAPKASEDALVVKPSDSDGISAILKLANRESIPVIPRGAGTGLCGGAVPIQPSIVVSLERLDEIIELDSDNMMITCQAGVTLESLFKQVEETGDLFFPPHPGDEGAQIGGLVVENAGGARAVRYGVIRNYVTGLKAVLPTGEIVKLGGKVLKNNTGYDLMHLLIGSEGTLAIITEATLRLYPEPKYSATLIISFNDGREAINSVPRILRQGITPLAIEYIEREHIQKSAHHLGEEWPEQKGKAYLMVIITGGSEEELYSKGESISEICQENNSLDILMAERSKDQEKILAIRSNLYATYQAAMAEDLDIAVPPTRLGKTLDMIDKTGDEFGVDIPTWGHAGDGNLHLHLMMEDGQPPKDLEEIKNVLYQRTISLGGVITGEHGVGKTRVKNLPLMFSQRELEIMKGIEKIFDPRGILNPGAVI